MSAINAHGIRTPDTRYDDANDAINIQIATSASAADGDDPAGWPTGDRRRMS